MVGLRLCYKKNKPGTLPYHLRSIFFLLSATAVSCVKCHYSVSTAAVAPLPIEPQQLSKKKQTPKLITLILLRDRSSVDTTISNSVNSTPHPWKLVERGGCLAIVSTSSFFHRLNSLVSWAPSSFINWPSSLCLCCVKLCSMTWHTGRLQRPCAGRCNLGKRHRPGDAGANMNITIAITTFVINSHMHDHLRYDINVLIITLAAHAWPHHYY